MSVRCLECGNPAPHDSVGQGCVECGQGIVLALPDDTERMIDRGVDGWDGFHTERMPDGLLYESLIEEEMD